jgi:hypothetical protein
LETNGYEQSRGGLMGDDFKTLIGILLAIVAGIGFIIVLLSLLVFLLNFRLIVSESAADIRLLLELGYQHFTISRLLSNRLMLLFGSVTVLAFGALVGVKIGMAGWFARQGFVINHGLHLYVWVGGIAFAVFFLFVNLQSIKRSVKKLAIS